MEEIREKWSRREKKGMDGWKGERGGWREGERGSKKSESPRFLHLLPVHLRLGPPNYYYLAVTSPHR